jgi:hypothetical protein
MGAIHVARLVATDQVHLTCHDGDPRRMRRSKLA